MAVTATFTRTGISDTTATSQEFITVGLTGTYVTGGFTSNPFTIAGGLGSSPVSGSRVLSAQWFSPLGYTYVSTVSGSTMTTKIYSAANTELSAGALPDASVPLILTKTKV